MSSPNWVRDKRPVRRVTAERAPSDGWPVTIPAIGQVVREGLDLESAEPSRSSRAVLRACDGKADEGAGAVFPGD